MEHPDNTAGLNTYQTYRKNPSVWTHCLCQHTMDRNPHGMTRLPQGVKPLLVPLWPAAQPSRRCCPPAASETRRNETWRNFKKEHSLKTPYIYNMCVC